MTTPLHHLYEHGQSVWMDNLSRTIIHNGELAEWIAKGVRGITSNPAIFKNAIAGNADYDAGIQAALGSGGTVNAIYESLVLQDISDAAALFLPVYEASQGGDGYISIEVSPKLAHSTASTVLEAQRFFQILGQPNIMIKIPGTSEGLPAVTDTIAAGINVNVTLLFSIQNYIETAWAYIAGLEKLDAAGGDVSGVASVASFFLSRIDSSIDKLLDAKIAQGQDLGSLKGAIAIANAKCAYQEYLKIFGSERFQKLAAKGAKPQRLLWASTSTKNPAYRDTLYVEELIGANTVNTVPPETLVAFVDHGQVATTLTEQVAAAEQALGDLAASGIDLEHVLTDLQTDGVEKFVQAFDQLFAALETKVQQMTVVGV